MENSSNGSEEMSDPDVQLMNVESPNLTNKSMFIYKQADRNDSNNITSDRVKKSGAEERKQSEAVAKSHNTNKKKRRLESALIEKSYKRYFCS